MHFDIDLDARLAAAISPTYEVGNYTGSIVAAIQSLSDIIRNKSGLDSDGQSLVGSAFGGSNPIVKLGALRTESERDEQKGIELLLRGVYTGIRNPRSHEVRQDSATDANAIIIFIDLMVRLIDGSKSPFDPDDIIDRVLDEHFVPTPTYANLLAAEVPPRIRLDVLIRLIEKVSYARAFNARAFVMSLLERMSEPERGQFWEYVSSKLMSGGYDNELITLVRVCAPSWSKCSEMARLRSENRLIKSVSEGKTSSDQKTVKGAVGLRLLDLNCDVISLKDELTRILVRKVVSVDTEEQEYVYKHFMPLLATLQPAPTELMKARLLKRLKDQDSNTYFSLFLIEQLPVDHPWRVAFFSAWEGFTFNDDIPF